MPKVSVIIPNYNHAPFLKERIDSVLNQTYQDFEVIILDDCSTDNSREIIEQYRNLPKVVQIEYNTTNSGSTFKQWEKGIKLAKGEWVWIAESDDVANPKLLSSLQACVTNNTSMVFCKSEIIDNHGKKSEFLQCSHFPNNKYWESFLNQNMSIYSRSFIQNEMYRFNQIVNSSSAIFRKRYFPQNDPFLTKFKLCGDWYVWINILSKGGGYYVDEALNYFRIHDRTVRSESKNEIFTYFENALIIRFILELYKCSKEVKIKYSDYLIYIYHNRYASEYRKGRYISFLRTLMPIGFFSIIKALIYSLRNGN
jgi:glycosyltransferase involved in cell wall biosynthesis